jgi:pimeloyl-ACP methyl ester carboxylesterase
MNRIAQLVMLVAAAISFAIAAALPSVSQTSILTSPPGEPRGAYEAIACSTLFIPVESEPSASGQSPIPNHGDAIEGTDYECGYLTAPEIHSQPNDNTIQVGIVILKSPNPNPAEPLVMFQGGPGGSSIALFPSLFLPINEFNQPILSEREVIIFEKRGNRYSRPFLNCPEYQETDSFGQITTEASAQTLQACRDRLVKEGINLAAFNSYESAHDVATLAQTLGYDQVNLYGVSYGTELAQDVMRLYPDLVRSVILDGVVPNDPSIDSQYAVILDRLITQVDAACAQDADCHSQYPDVKGTFTATYKQLNQTPDTVPFFSAVGLEQRPLTGTSLANAIFQMSYASGAPFVIPALIYQASEGNYSMILNQQYLGGHGGIATGTYYSVKCAEDMAYNNGLNTAGVSPLAAEWGGKLLNSMEAACQVWDVPALAPSSRQAVVSDVPALIWNGNFDPITPPPFGEAVARGFNNSTFVVFPANGHGAIGSLPCSFEIMAAFVNNPDQSPDVSCASEGKIEFVTSKNTLIAPGTAWLSRSLFELNLVPLLQRILLLVLLILFPVVWLVLWLLGRRCHHESSIPVSTGAKLAPWLGVLLALLSIGWVWFQIIGLEMTAVRGGPNFFLGINRIFVGIDRHYAWIYLLPIFIALASLGMVWLAVMAWKHKYWDKRRRFYYAFTAGVAIAYTVFLASAGQLTVFL